MSSSTAVSRILWQRLDTPGHEWCEVSQSAGGIRLSGVALVSLDDRPHHVEYTLEVDADGRTRRVTVAARGSADRTLELTADGRGLWMAGAEVVVDARDEPAALDVDLGFSPLTNSLPIWRLSPLLAIGDSAAIRVAWVLYPELDVVLGRQWYDRLDTCRWRYRSDGFQAELQLGEDGLVEDYQGIWTAIART